MTTCQVPHCDHPAVFGNDWRSAGLVPLAAYNKGIEMTLTVRDAAVVLMLCDEHARELTAAAWAGALEKLGNWDWRP